jgi:hypothetical protein
MMQISECINLILAITADRSTSIITNSNVCTPKGIGNCLIKYTKIQLSNEIIITLLKSIYILNSLNPSKSTKIVSGKLTNKTTYHGIAYTSISSN